MNQDKLVILWTTPNPDTSTLMVFQYAENALLHGWWKDIQIVVWGASAKLVAENNYISKKLLQLRDAGVKISCCIACAKKLGVDTKLKSLGFQVTLWGEPLSDLIKKDITVLSI